MENDKRQHLIETYLLVIQDILKHQDVFHDLDGNQHVGVSFLQVFALAVRRKGTYKEFSDIGSMIDHAIDEGLIKQHTTDATTPGNHRIPFLSITPLGLEIFSDLVKL